MKVYLSCMLATLTALGSNVGAKPLHAGLDYHRYLLEEEKITNEVSEYFKSKAAEEAMQMGVWSREKESRDGEPTEDEKQRFFMAKQLVEDLSKDNPEAEFSTDSPFTMMTGEEFKKYVGLAYGGNKDPTSTFLGVQNNSTTSDSDDDYSRWLMEESEYSPATSKPKSRSRSCKPKTRSPTSAPGPAPGPSPAPTSKPTSGPSPNPGPAPTSAPGPGPYGPVSPTSAPGPTPAPGPEMDYDTSGGVDWNAKGCQTPVRNQGQCGSCWAFAAVAAIESALCIKNGGEIPQLSDQMMTSCDTRNMGCNGGVPAWGIEWVQKNGGLCTEESYPYTGTGKGSCNQSCKKVSFSISEGVRVSGDESNLVEAVKKQPVVVAVYAGNNAWKQYKGGVLSNCPSSTVDHAVVAYGYTKDAYLVKNSWGTAWGENGIVRLARNTGGKGICGIMTQAVYPTIG